MRAHKANNENTHIGGGFPALCLNQQDVVTTILTAAAQFWQTGDYRDRAQATTPFLGPLYSAKQASCESPSTATQRCKIFSFHGNN